MYPFGGTPRCHRCDKAVYAAEQVMGPGRKMYHKPCLTCTTCKKRLDSVSLVEHDQEPYCKLCHVRNFGNPDLRQANLPDRDEVFGLSPTRIAHSPPSSPRKGDPAPSLPPRTMATPLAVDGATNSLGTIVDNEGEVESHSSVPTHISRGPNGLPRTVPLSPSSKGYVAVPGVRPARSFLGGPYVATMGRSSSAIPASGQALQPLRTTATGTRYGLALTEEGKLNGRAQQWGGGATPHCPRCGGSVYFAEQIKAIGKTYHKGCLRCTECSNQLDSTRLTERDGSPFCHRCYGKLYGPQGSGYALLGKAGG